MEAIKTLTVGIVALLALTALPMGTVAESEPVSIAERVRTAITAEALAQGIDPEEIFATTVTIDQWGVDGLTQVQISLGEAIDQVVGSTQAIIASNGPAGTPEILIGNTLHLYIHIGGCGSFGYTIRASPTIPATPPLAPAGGLGFYSVGGPTYNIRGTYLIGLHTAGVGLGTGVSTAESGPYPNPSALLTVLPDNKIDFIGHAAASQVRICIFGVLGIGFGLALTDGVAQFDARPIAGQSTAFPNVP